MCVSFVIDYAGLSPEKPLLNIVFFLFLSWQEFITGRHYSGVGLPHG